MKLLQIKGKRALTATAKLLRPINNLVKEKSVTDFMSNSFLKQNEETDYNRGINILLGFIDLLPDLLENHSDDIIQILAAVQDIEVEKYEKEVTVSKIISDINDLRQDEDLLSLFFSASRRNVTN